MLSLNRLGLRSPSLSASCLWLMNTISDHRIAYIQWVMQRTCDTVLCLLFMSNWSTIVDCCLYAFLCNKTFTIATANCRPYSDSYAAFHWQIVNSWLPGSRDLVNTTSRLEWNAALDISICRIHRSMHAAFKTPATNTCRPMFCLEKFLEHWVRTAARFDMRPVWMPHYPFLNSRCHITAIRCHASTASG